ncbi:Hsp20/alpha crystallin family protein [Roseovarius sp. SCSIO 43702]|uniref:Hsp20/alpha crystallin family protein n=1 Tax=Roseovarius sp. SCSIO 43702 TaxID=2823043 RepID=UPI001C739701|nr:Hsp20/alpha crystallin family protein [Roseovarius sp. SCSIO 43702]QYX55692.1 Hsp20/alpha crystallin family protein [Roseovarius sp. SCSIO 43702]
MANEVKKTSGDVARTDDRQNDQTGPTFRPATDIFEKDDVVTLAIDMPGVDPGSVDVSVENRSLTVRGTIDAPAPEGYRRIYAEYGPGTFERAFSLPDTIDADGIEANHKNGVLTLTLKKSEAAKPKQIKVKAA